MNFPVNIHSLSTMVQLPPNTVIDFERDENGSPAVVYFLDEGICALAGLTKVGTEMIYFYLRSGSLCPLGFTPFAMTGESSEQSNPPLYTITKTPCTLYKMKSAQLVQILHTDSSLQQQLLQDIYKNYRNAFLRCKQLQEDSTLVNVCRLLISVAEDQNGKRVVPKFFTYAEIANYIGKHHITVSRIMADLREKGYIIKTSSGTIIQREEDLIKMIQENSVFQYEKL